MDDPHSHEQLLEQAGAVFDDLCARLPFDAEPPKPDLQLSRTIGGDRARSRVHPSESLAAAGVIFEALMSEAARTAEQLPGAVGLTARAGAILQSSLTLRLRQGAAGYASRLLQEIQQAHAVERRRVARDLHDRVGSAIGTALSFLELHELSAEANPVKAAESLAVARAAVRQALEDLRSVTVCLRRGQEVESLEKALRTFVDLTPHAGTTIHVEVNGDERWVPAQLLDQLFFITREAMRNAVEHSAARTIVVQVDIEPTYVRSRVEDDGEGFNPAGQADTAAGLTSMRERAALIGGVVIIHSAPGQGCRVEALVPLSEEDHDDRR